MRAHARTRVFILFACFIHIVDIVLNPGGLLLPRLAVLVVLEDALLEHE